MRSVAKRRWVGVSILVILLALTLQGLAFASHAEASGAQISAQSPPRPEPTTPSPRPSPTTPSPRPTPTEPYPGGVGIPLGPEGNSFFVGENSAAPGLGRDLTTVLWIALAVLGVGMAARWLLMAARPNDSA